MFKNGGIETTAFGTERARQKLRNLNTYVVKISVKLRGSLRAVFTYFEGVGYLRVYHWKLATYSLKLFVYTVPQVNSLSETAWTSPLSVNRGKSVGVHVVYSLTL
jgi:hypothetical protein